jgi:hypothetical protein
MYIIKKAETVLKIKVRGNSKGNYMKAKRDYQD